MPTFAADTQVTPERSRAEIERTLQRYGATGFMYGYEGSQAMVAFRMNGRMIRFLLPLPDRAAPQFQTRTVTRAGAYHRYEIERKATPDEALDAWEQACRQKWRALALLIKAKLESIESGIATFEDEFLANTLLPDGQTVAQWMGPQVERAYLNGTMPALLPLLGDGRREGR